jgi:hypothetical protein
VCLRRGLEVEYGHRTQRTGHNPDYPAIQIRLRWSVGISSILLTFGLAFAEVPQKASVVDQAPPVTSACEAQAVHGPLFITESCSDPELSKPYVDVRRPGTMADEASGVSVSFTYVHGGFNGTKARFSFYFPAAEKYKDRFFQTTYPTIGVEDAAPGCPEIGTSTCSVVFALSSGAYVVSTNNAGGVPAGGPLAAYRTNAAAAKYSRLIAKEIYKTGARPRGYLYGASGGAYQTVGSMENTSGVWDGAVPMVFGVPNAIPNFMASQLLALRVLRDKLPQIADAVAPGGSGDPFAGLSAAQRDTLKEVTRLGFPLRGWWQYATLNGGGFWAVEGAVRAIDPSYVEDFWSKPGYEGNESSVQAARVRQDTTVKNIGEGNELVLGLEPSKDLLNGDLIIVDGPKAGQSVVITGIEGNKVKVVNASGITAGTAVRLDNSWAIALEYYSRHQVPTPHEYGWDPYVKRDGAPLYPQRSVIIGPILNASSAGSVASGRFHGKMIMAESVLDVSAYPWSADWYRQQSLGALGDLSGSFRLWYMDNADHGPDIAGYSAGVAFEHSAHAADHIVSYLGEVQQALLDLDAWVAQGIAPPESTNYRIDAEDQVRLEPDAELRRGIQPIVTLAAGKTSDLSSHPIAVVKKGRDVIFWAKAETPPSAGKIVKVEWDFEGDGRFTSQPVSIGRQFAFKEVHRFVRPGTYFPVVRVTAQREGDANTSFGLVQNLASMRVTVR